MSASIKTLSGMQIGVVIWCHGEGCTRLTTYVPHEEILEKFGDVTCEQAQRKVRCSVCGTHGRNGKIKTPAPGEGSGRTWFNDLPAMHFSPEILKCGQRLRCQCVQITAAATGPTVARVMTPMTKSKFVNCQAGARRAAARTGR